MTEYKLTREEQETIFRTSAADKEWDICTADPRFIRYLIKQGYAPEADNQFSHPYMAFTVPFNRLRLLKREKRQPTGRPFESRRLAPEHVSSS